MRSQTIGEILQQARTRKKISLDELAELTKIKIKYLVALEANQFDQLPAAIFVQGYIKAYSRVLQFDDQPLLALLRRDYAQSQTGQLLARSFIQPVLRRGQFWRPMTLVAAGAAIFFVILLGYVGWQWRSLNRPPKLEISTPAENELVAAKVVVRGQTDPEAMVAINAQPISIQADGTFQAEINLPKEGMTTITVEAIDSRGKKIEAQRVVYVKF